MVAEDDARFERPTAPPTVGPVLHPEAVALLDLLADGVPVSTAAVRLHLSRRTAARRLADAREVLGVDTTAEAVLAHCAARRASASADAPPPPPLVGRGDAVGGVVSALARDGAVLLVGEGGIGKSTLMAEAARRDGRPVHGTVAGESLRWTDFGAVASAADLRNHGGDLEAVTVAVESAVGPDLLLLDDAHLADEGSLAVLAALVGRVAVLVAARPDRADDAARPVARLADAGFRVQRLDPLTDDEARSLVRVLAPGLDDPVVESVVAQAGGLPLLVEILSGAAAEGGPGGGPGAAFDALSEDARAEALRLALADGWLPVAATTDELVSAGMAVLGPDGVRIRHAVVADAVVAAAPRSDRVSAHRALAERTDDPGVAARQWAAAGDATRAVDTALSAAAESRSPGQRALLLRLAATSCRDDRRDALTLSAARALSVAGRHAEVLELAHRVGHGPPDETVLTLPALEARPLAGIERGHLDLLVARAWWHLGDAPAAVATARAALADVAGSGTDAEAGLLTEIVRCESLSVGSQPDHEALLARAREVTDGLERGRGVLLNVAGLAAYVTTGAGLEEWQEGRVAAEAEGDIDSLMRCANNVVGFQEGSGDALAGLSLAREMAEEAHRLGLGEWRAQFLAMAANILFHRGRYAEALAAVDVVDATAIDHRTRTQAWNTRVATLLDLGLLDAARSLLPEQPPNAAWDWQLDVTPSYLLATFEFWSGRPREALRALEPVFETGNDGLDLHWFARGLRAWAEYDLGLPVTTSEAEVRLPMCEGIRAEAAGVALLSKDPIAAIELLDAAVELGRDRSAGLAMRAAWGAGEARRLAGSPDAVDVLLDVEKRVTDAGMEALLTRVHRSLRLAGVRRAATRGLDRTGLVTAREREVLELVGRGFSYAQIARRLGVGRPTVRQLLDNARLKLGAASGLAAAAALAASS